MYVYIYIYKDDVCIHTHIHTHILHIYTYTYVVFIHSANNGHLGGFYMLAIVNYAAVKYEGADTFST